MPYEPDIIALSRDAPEVMLVAEAKLALPEPARIERALAEYIRGVNCPVGLVVTPHALWIYRDTYHGVGPGALELVGSYDLADTFTRASRMSGSGEGEAFEHEVQEWLSEVAAGTLRGDLPAETKQAIAEHVVPALWNVEVRAAGPRWRRAG